MAQLEMASRQVRHVAEAGAARARGDLRLAERHTTLAESARAAGVFYASRAQLGEQLEAAHKEWATQTAPMRLQAVQADALLRRRHPELQLDPLTSAEPEPLADELPTAAADATSRHAAMVAARLARFRAEMDSRAGILIPHEDPDYEPEGEAWPGPGRPRRDAVPQPPRPSTRPPQPRMPERDLEPQG